MAFIRKVTAKTFAAISAYSQGGFARAWSNPQNVTADDGSVASQSVAVTGNNDRLFIGYHITIPSTASVCGFQSIYHVNGGGATSANPVFSEAMITYNGTLNPTEKQYATIQTTNIYVTAGGPQELWIMTAASFSVSGIGLAIQANKTGAGSVGFSLDYVPLTIYYDKPWNVLPVTATPHFGHEIDSVDISKIIGNFVITHVDKGYEISPPALVQINAMQVSKTKFGFEIDSPSINDYTPQFGFEIDGPKLTTQFNFTVTNAEFGYKQSLVDLTLFKFAAPDNCEYEFEISSPLLRQFKRGASHHKRRVIVGPNPRTITVNYEVRTTKVPVKHRTVYVTKPGRRIRVIFEDTEIDVIEQNH